jgi:hypothetical protein
METNYEALEVISKFLWGGDSEMWKALSDYHCCWWDTIYSNEYLLKSYRKLLETIIEDWLHYDANKCIYNSSS